ncbi:MAG: polysaccharide biosynthesis tyrosine autokinase [Nocardioides sp.]|nr:polysaccharide biosynthesis tyrosine autokinase [Nocardioides sp.]
MELADYLKVLRRRWPWIVVTAVVCTLAAFAFTFTQTKEYASTARLFVSTSTLEDTTALNQGGEFSQARVQSYADLVSSRELAQKVIDQLGLHDSADDLQDRVEATAVVNTVNLTITAKDTDPHRAQRITQAYAEQLSALIKRLETPAGSKEKAPIQATIVDPADFSATPVSPVPLRNVGIGLALGLLLGFGAAVLRQSVDTRITSAEDLAEVVDAPMLGAIIHDPASVKTPLISAGQPHSPRAEAFRVLRTNLQFVDVDKQHKVFVVTSAVPEEGKTSTATNLAISLAQAGVRTLLLEGDLRRPKAHQKLGLDGAIGLTNLLVGHVGLEDAVQTHAETGLSFLASGPVPPNPAELLQTKAMSDVMTQMRLAYDVVIIDAPPLLPVTDAALLAAKADGALLLVRHRKATREQVRHSMDRLDQVDADLIGVVLNDVPGKSKKYGYGYGYGYAPTDDKPQKPGRPGKARRASSDPGRLGGSRTRVAKSLRPDAPTG